jgi:hypothetical protein
VNTSTPTRLDIVAAAGLAISGVFGLSGTVSLTMAQTDRLETFTEVSFVLSCVRG